MLTVGEVQLTVLRLQCLNVGEHALFDPVNIVNIGYTIKQVHVGAVCSAYIKSS